MDDRTFARLLAAAVVVALLVPASARAAELTVAGTCFASGQQATLSGSSFTPGAAVAIAGGATGAAQADAAGVFTTAVMVAPTAELGPRTVTVTAVDRANAANVGTVALKVVREAFGSNRPIAGRPHDITKWRFAGFEPGQPIYAHFLLNGRLRGDYRFGVAHGDCGTLTVRAARIPGVRELRPGRWTLKLDQRMTYRRHTPGSTATFRIVRRSGSAR